MKIILQNVPEWFDWLSLIIIPILCVFITTVVNVLLVNRNTNKQIANQNKQTYMPRLKLINFINQNRNLSKPEYMFFYGEYDMNNSFTVFSLMKLKNIGNGIANDIIFFSLNTGEMICSGQSCKSNINQTGFSTEEIPSNEDYTIPFCFSFNEEDINQKKLIGELPCMIICNYKDLNNNNYKILIIYSFKNRISTKGIDEGEGVVNDCNYNFYYCQENTYHYNEMIKTYNKSYQKILNIINDYDKTSKSLIKYERNK